MASFYQSTIGKKVVVAVTGLILVGFVFVHLLGNLQVFLGAAVVNDYAVFLRSKPGFLWLTRIVLLISVLLHIINTVQLRRRNKDSRPIPYINQENIQANLASRTLFWGGLFLAVYIVYHLLHFTWGSVHPDFSHTDIYGNMVKGFSVWYVSAFYILGMVALGFHLYHGVWSVFQTLGFNHPKWNVARRAFATVVSVGIAVGYIFIPVSVMVGILK